MEPIKSAIEWGYSLTFVVAIERTIKYIQAYDDIINNAPYNAVNKKGYSVEFFGKRLSGVLDAVTTIQNKIKEIENG